LCFQKRYLKYCLEIKTAANLDVKVTYDKFKIPIRTTFPYTHEEALRWQEQAKKTLDEKEKLVIYYPKDIEGVERLKEAARELVAKGDIGKTIGPRTLDKFKVDYWLATQAVNQSKRIEALPANPAPYLMPMQAIRIGTTVFVTFPAEVFTEIGLSVKQKSPYANTFILGVAGGFNGYIATAAEYIEGGYAVNGSPYAPQAEQALIDASMELIGRVK
jgi:neutral ceramidase